MTSCIPGMLETVHMKQGLYAYSFKLHTRACCASLRLHKDVSLCVSANAKLWEILRSSKSEFHSEIPATPHALWRPEHQQRRRRALCWMRTFTACGFCGGRQMKCFATHYYYTISLAHMRHNLGVYIRGTRDILLRSTGMARVDYIVYTKLYVHKIRVNMGCVVMCVKLSLSLVSCFVLVVFCECVCMCLCWAI